MDISAYLDQLPFLKYATDEELKIITQYAYHLSFSKGEVLHARSQAECLGVALVLTGSFCVSMISDEGKQVILYRLDPGEVSIFTARCMLGMLSYEVMVEGESNGTALVIPASALNVIVKNVMIEKEMYKLALQRCSIIMHTLERIMFCRVDKRLAQCLLLEAEKHGTNRLNLTHEQLARDISSAREVVSRTLAKFSREGLIRMCRGTIIISDPEGLALYK